MLESALVKPAGLQVVQRTKFVQLDFNPKKVLKESQVHSFRNLAILLSTNLTVFENFYACQTSSWVDILSFPRIANRAKPRFLASMSKCQNAAPIGRFLS